MMTRAAIALAFAVAALPPLGARAQVDPRGDPDDDTQEPDDEAEVDDAEPPQAQPAPPSTARPRSDAAEAAELLSEMRAMAEVQRGIGRMGAERGSTPRVRRFGERVERDYAMAERAMTALAARRKMQLESGAPGPVVRILEQLGTRTGSEFDDGFLSLERAIDSRLLGLLVQTAPAIDDREARRLVEHMEPIVDQHLRLSVLLEKEARP